MEYLFIVLVIISITAFYEIRLRKVKESLKKELASYVGRNSYYKKRVESMSEKIEELTSQLKVINNKAKKAIYKKEGIHNQPDTDKV